MALVAHAGQLAPNKVADISKQNRLAALDAVVKAGLRLPVSLPTALVDLEVGELMRNLEKPGGFDNVVKVAKPWGPVAFDFAATAVSGLAMAMEDKITLDSGRPPPATRSKSSGTHCTHVSLPTRDRSRLSTPKVVCRYFLRSLLTIGTVRNAKTPWIPNADHHDTNE